MTGMRPQHPLEDRALLAEVARSLVSHPVQVRVNETHAEKQLILNLYVLPEDRGQIIGKDGKTIRLIRRLFSAIGLKDGREVLVQLVQDD